MAKSILSSDSIKVIIDGFPVENLWEFGLEMGTYDYDWSFEGGAMYRDRPSNVQATLRSGDGIEMKFNVLGKEQVGNTVYFYGPLRALFPEIFKEIDPVEWQVAYLIAMGRPSLDRFKVRRSDDYFTGDRAIAFRLGYEAGKVAGVETERKLANISAEGLKNPPKSKDNRAMSLKQYNGILGEALKKKQGK